MSKKETKQPQNEKDIANFDDKGLIIKIDSHLDRVEASINNYTHLLGSLERKLLLNSVLSYIVFFIVVTAFSYIIFIERNTSLVNENGTLKNDIAKYDQEVKRLNEEINGYKTTDQKTKLLLEEFSNSTADPKKLVDDYEAMNRTFFSEVEKRYFTERVNKLKIDLSIKFYESGKNFFQSNSYSKSVAEFLESLKYNPKNPYINEINFFLGVSYLRMKKYSESIPYLEKAMVNNFDRKRADDILYYLGNAYERLSNTAKAREYYKKVIEQYSTGDKYWEAKKRWSVINRR